MKIGRSRIVAGVIVFSMIGVFIVCLAAFPLDAQKGERVNAWGEISDRDNAGFTVLSASMTVMDWSKTFTMQSTILANITTANPASIKLPRMYALVDTTAASFTSGSTYRVKFMYWVDNETKIKWIDLSVW